MTYKENIKAILECYFTGFKEEIIDSACNRILEQEPKIGHWKFVQRGKYIDICCSNCDFQRVKEYAYNYTVDQISKQEQDIKDFFSKSNMNFCENCGAKMIKPQESEEV